MNVHEDIGTCQQAWPLDGITGHEGRRDALANLAGDPHHSTGLDRSGCVPPSPCLTGMRTTSVLGCASLLLIPLTACSVSGGTTPLPTDRLAEGTWGATDNGALVRQDGVHIHMGCTKGDFPAPIILDADGRFRVSGSYVLRAYPVQREALPAQVAGIVQGNRLTFTIAVNDTVNKVPVALGPVTLTFGVEPRMANCPICRAPGLAAPGTWLARWWRGRRA